MRTIELTEHQPLSLAHDQLSQSIGERLWRDYPAQVDVEFPSPRTAGRWRLTARGWAGHIPLSRDVSLSLQPKVPLRNIFHMLEYAYQLDLRILHGVFESDSLEEFYERLAHVLARRVLDRERKGLYRAYVPRVERLPFVRGRIVPQSIARTAWDANLICEHDEHTRDITDNQILAWTLYIIARSGLCSERTLPAIRRAHRALRNTVTLRSFNALDCDDRIYHRLNDDYRALHALCRFFLDHSGPRHASGEQLMMPFLIDMARLYEMFVAEWLKSHPMIGNNIKAQQRIDIGRQGNLHFAIDLVLYDNKSNLPRVVIDTKYKTPTRASTDDIAQVVAYAQAIDCREAVLLYPVALPEALDAQVGDIRVRSLTFALDDDLEEAGERFVTQIA